MSYAGLEEYMTGDEVGKIGCEHGYHMDCIKQWLQLKNWCPICKASVEPRETSHFSLSMEIETKQSGTIKYAFFCKYHICQVKHSAFVSKNLWRCYILVLEHSDMTFTS
ncbi:hypothetical protein POM88_001808 [Heracleum sosnowskyi]|uniref:RING-type E3 ubiquitin transferase n=1 Tax=Heracleum sosnowskyi TaxID=360622 RepID=A0AAD8JE96_9APIA|nr:hypothetical protein POM88_001808 [Heracleum sosnowskyi]